MLTITSFDTTCSSWKQLTNNRPGNSIVGAMGPESAVLSSTPLGTSASASELDFDRRPLN